MAGFLTAAATTFGLVAVEEMADKTQLILLALAARGHAWRIWAGASSAFVLLTVAAAAAGGLLAALVPDWAVRVLAGLTFLGFGLWSLLRPEAEEERPVRQAGFGAAFGLILVAEMGDKTQLAVAALAADTGRPVAVAIGGGLALVLVALLPVLAGPWIARRVSLQRLERIGAWLFVAVGSVLLASLAF